jgi:hypothetical protein
VSAAVGAPSDERRRGHCFPVSAVVGAASDERRRGHCFPLSAAVGAASRRGRTQWDDATSRAVKGSRAGDGARRDGRGWWRSSYRAAASVRPPIQSTRQGWSECRIVSRLAMRPCEGRVSTNVHKCMQMNSATAFNQLCGEGVLAHQSRRRRARVLAACASRVGGPRWLWRLGWGAPRACLEGLPFDCLGRCGTVYCVL